MLLCFLKIKQKSVRSVFCPLHWECPPDSFILLFVPREVCCLQCLLLPWKWKRATLVGPTPQEATRPLGRPLQGKHKLLSAHIVLKWKITRNGSMTWDLHAKTTQSLENVSREEYLDSNLRTLLLFSLKENRPLSKAFFSTMIQIEKEQVCTAALYSLCEGYLQTFPWFQTFVFVEGDKWQILLNHTPAENNKLWGYWNMYFWSEETVVSRELCFFCSSRRLQRWTIWETTMRGPCRNLAPQMKVSRNGKALRNALVENSVCLNC